MKNKKGKIIIIVLLVIILLLGISILTIINFNKPENIINIEDKKTECKDEKVTVTYDCDGGTGGGSETFICGKEGQKITKTCTKKGEKQDGWKQTNQPTSKDYEKDSVITDSWIIKHSPKVTLYAHWKGIEIKCIPGEYLEKGKKICKKCLSGYYCPGGKYSLDQIKNQGIKQCPKGYINSKKGSKKISDCFIKVENIKYIKKPKDIKKTDCPKGQTRLEHNVYYGETSNYCNCIKAPSIKVNSTSLGKKYIVGNEIKNKEEEKQLNISGCITGLNGFSCYKNSDGTNCINQNYYRNNKEYKNEFGETTFTKRKWLYYKKTDQIWVQVCNKSKCTNYYIQ